MSVIANKKSKNTQDVEDVVKEQLANISIDYNIVPRLLVCFANVCTST